MVAYKHEKKKKNLRELLTKASLYNTINIVVDEMQTYVPCNKRINSCTKFVFAKSSFEYFTTKRIYGYTVYLSVSKNVIYITF